MPLTEKLVRALWGACAVTTHIVLFSSLVASIAFSIPDASVDGKGHSYFLFVPLILFLYFFFAPFFMKKLDF